MMNSTRDQKLLDGFKCDKCYKIFGTKLTLKILNNSVYEGIKFQCDTCEKQYGTLGAL